VSVVNVSLGLECPFRPCHVHRLRTQCGVVVDLLPDIYTQLPSRCSSLCCPFHHLSIRSIAPLSPLGGPQLIHLLHALFELVVLALLIRMSLVLCQISFRLLALPFYRMFAHLALPRQIELLVPTPVQRDEQVCAGIAVCERESGGAHFFACGFCEYIRTAACGWRRGGTDLPARR
jgi:hypothetical protein